jgi:hypothetical protein
MVGSAFVTVIEMNNGKVVFVQSQSIGGVEV